MFFDVNKIKEELLPINIITYLQIPFVRSGKNIFILCPEHELNTGFPDKHFGNCVLGDSFYNAYYCFSCGAKGDCFKLIALLQNLDLKKDFFKICEIASDSLGGSELYSVSTLPPKQSKQNSNNVNSLTKEQLEILQLSPKNFPYIYTEGFTGDFNLDEHYIKQYDYSSERFPTQEFLAFKPMNYSIQNLANENEAIYSSFVKQRAEELMKKYKTLAKKDWIFQVHHLFKVTNKDHIAFCQHLEDFYKLKYLEVESIWKSFATPEEIEDINDSWLYSYDFDF
jgi:hypothetical protein